MDQFVFVHQKTPGWEWLPKNALLAVPEGRAFTEKEQELFSHYHRYSSDASSFVMYNPHVVEFFEALLPDSGSPEEFLERLVANARGTMDMGLRSHPDFDTYGMNDQMMAVRLFNDMWCFYHPEDIPGCRHQDYEPDLRTALAMRSEILECCEEERIFAVCLIRE